MSLFSLGGSYKDAENTIFENGDLNDLKQRTLLIITRKATFSDKRVLNVSHQVFVNNRSHLYNGFRRS